MSRLAAIVLVLLATALAGCMGPSVHCYQDTTGRTQCIDLSRPAPPAESEPPPSPPAPMTP